MQDDAPASHVALLSTTTLSQFTVVLSAKLLAQVPHPCLSAGLAQQPQTTIVDLIYSSHMLTELEVEPRFFTPAKKSHGPEERSAFIIRAAWRHYLRWQPPPPPHLIMILLQ